MSHVENETKGLLIGTWKSTIVNSEYGPSVTTVTFDDKATFKLTTTFTNSSEHLSLDGKYTVKDEKIFASEWNKGNAIKIISLTKNVLTLDLEKEEVMFERIESVHGNQ